MTRTSNIDRVHGCCRECRRPVVTDFAITSRPHACPNCGASLDDPVKPVHTGKAIAALLSLGLREQENA